MMMIPAKSYIVDTNNSQWLTFSVSDLCPQRRYSPTRNYTAEHKLALPKLLNIMAFNPSQKRMSYETLTLVSEHPFMRISSICIYNNMLWLVI